MNYWLLCLCDALAAFAIVLLATHLLSALLQSRLNFGRVGSQKAGALIFVLRVIPATVSTLLTTALVLPAFLKLEPVGTQEAPGVVSILLAAVASSLICASLVRTLRSVRAGAQLKRRWMASNSRLITSRGKTPVLEISMPGAVVATVGFLRPAVFVSSSVVRVLSPPELEAAISHELAHVATFDNLKRLLMRALALSWPHRYSEAQWAAACEVAADNRALVYGTSPLDLASALVKVARLVAAPVPGTALVASLVSPGRLPERVHRLLQNPALEQRSTNRLRIAAIGAGLGLLLFAAVWPHALATVHQLTELFAR